MDKRLQQLLDKQDITDLIHAYCNAADRHDHKKLRALYHEDATDDHGSFFSGAAMAFIDQMPDIQAPMKILHHNVTTMNIAVDGDYAEGEVYVLAFHQVQVDAGTADLLIGGRYLDRYEKRKDQWKFSHRTIVTDWARHVSPSEVSLDHPMVEGSHIGQPGPNDPSYAFFRLLQRGIH